MIFNLDFDDLNFLRNSLYSSKRLRAPASKNTCFTVHPKELELFSVAGIDFKDEEDVIYKYNNDGFRCDDFLPAKNRTLVFSGCSEGEGIGGNLSESWPKIVYDGINHNSYYDGFFNLSCDNFGYNEIIDNCIAYVNKYGKPKAFIILFPDISRAITWNSNNAQYANDWINIKREITDYDKDRMMSHIFNFINKISIFEEYCSVANIDLYWSTTSEEDMNMAKSLGIFKNFVFLDYIKYPIEGELEKRDGHAGYAYHLSWAKNLIDRIENARI
jgi:hypothetical protein